MHALSRGLVCGACLVAAVTASADVLVFECAGKESIYAKTFEEHQQNLVDRPATVQVTMDRQKKTLKLTGTTASDGAGELTVTPTSFSTLYAKEMIIYEVQFHYVQLNLPQAGNKLSVFVTTHPDLAAPDAEGRLLFDGICRLPRKI